MINPRNQSTGNPPLIIEISLSPRVYFCFGGASPRSSRPTACQLLTLLGKVLLLLLLGKASGPGFLGRLEPRMKDANITGSNNIWYNYLPFRFSDTDLQLNICHSYTFMLELTQGKSESLKQYKSLKGRIDTTYDSIAYFTSQSLSQV